MLAEKSREIIDDSGIAEGINNGIVYLMAIPYVVVGALIFLVYRKLKS